MVHGVPENRLRLFAVIAAWSLFVCGCAETKEVSQLTAENVEKIEIYPGEWSGPGSPPNERTIKEPEAIRALLESLKPVGEVPRGQVADRAKIVVMEKTGKKILLRLQPGSDPGYYEYVGQGKAFKINRAPFLAALKQMGVDWLPE